MFALLWASCRLFPQVACQEAGCGTRPSCCPPLRLLLLLFECTHCPPHQHHCIMHTRTHAYAHHTCTKRSQRSGPSSSCGGDCSPGKRFRSRRARRAEIRRRRWPHSLAPPEIAAQNIADKVPSSTLLVRGVGCFCRPADDACSPAQGAREKTEARRHAARGAGTRTSHSITTIHILPICPPRSHRWIGASSRLLGGLAQGRRRGGRRCVARDQDGLYSPIPRPCCTPPGGVERVPVRVSPTDSALFMHEVRGKNSWPQKTFREAN